VDWGENMRVYIATSDNGLWTEILGVYSTREAAQDRVMTEFAARRSGRPLHDFGIDGWEIDGERFAVAPVTIETRK